MAIIKCKECNEEMSDKAKFCPKCGAENTIIFCPECGKKLSSKALMCPSCGYYFKNVGGKGNAYGLGVASVCLAIMSFFVPFPLFHILAFIFGIVAFCSNLNTKNSAKRLGDVGMALTILSFIFFIARFS